MGVQTYSIDGLHVEHFAPAEPGMACPLLFVHGSWGGSWMFQNYLTYLSNGGWNCYAMNLRGHYKSEKISLRGISQWEYAQDVIRVAKTLPSSPVVIGFGMGAQIIQHAFTQKLPAVGAVFISAKRPFVTSQEIPDYIRELPPLLTPSPLAPISDITPKSLAAMNDLMAQEVEARESVLTLLRGSNELNYEAVPVPYLVLNGEQDDQISQDEGVILAQVYRGPGTYQQVPGATHEGMLLGIYWRNAANALNVWLQTYGFDQSSRKQQA